MSWFAQLRHVMMKDVRQTWRPLGAYAAVVLLATVYAVFGPFDNGGVYQAGMFFIVVLGVLLCALLVQADSPTRAHAFWASKPLAPSAVMSTKFALVLLAVVGIPLIGVLAALISLDVTGADLARLVGTAAGIYAAWLLAAIVAAALTDDLRSFVTAIVVVSVALLCIVALLPESFPRAISNSWIHRGLAVAGVGGAIALVAFVYRRRYTSRRIWVAGFSAIACLLLSLVVDASSSHAGTPAASMPIHVTIDTSALERLGEVRYSVRADSVDPRLRLSFSTDTLDIRLGDGTRIYLHPMNGGARLQDPPLPAPGVTHWLGDATARTWGFPRSETIVVQLDDDDRSRLSRGVAAVELVGHVTTSEARLIATVPLATGATWTSDGTRMRIQSLSSGAGASHVTLIGFAVARGGSGIESGNYALINASRHEAMMVGHMGMSTYNTWLLVPGVALTETSQQLQAAAMNGGTIDFSIPPSWFAGARLAVFEWRPRGTYTTRSVVTLAAR